jgi:hypothetical protein
MQRKLYEGHKDNVDWFNRNWRWCADHGYCDDIQGAEYQRVRREWFDAGCPDDVDLFIRRHANLPSINPAAEGGAS